MGERREREVEGDGGRAGEREREGERGRERWSGLLTLDHSLEHGDRAEYRALIEP